MTNETDTLSLLTRALEGTADLIDGLSPDVASRPTPCASWNVGTLVSHLINDLSTFQTAAQGEMPDWSRPPLDYRPEEWAGAFRAGSTALLDTWQGADLDAPVPGPTGEQPLIRRADQQIAELATHAWDLARAVGRPVDLDPEGGAHALDWARRSLRPEFRGSEDEGKVFGPEVAVAPDAPVYDQLAGWFGRDPKWSPPRS